MRMFSFSMVSTQHVKTRGSRRDLDQSFRFVVHYKPFRLREEGDWCNKFLSVSHFEYNMRDVCVIVIW